jgi:hypothetical protein
MEALAAALRVDFDVAAISEELIGFPAVSQVSATVTALHAVGVPAPARVGDAVAVVTALAGRAGTRAGAIVEAHAVRQVHRRGAANALLAIGTVIADVAAGAAVGRVEVELNVARIATDRDDAVAAAGLEPATVAAHVPAAALVAGVAGFAEPEASAGARPVDTFFARGASGTAGHRLFAVIDGIPTLLARASRAIVRCTARSVEEDRAARAGRAAPGIPGATHDASQSVAARLVPFARMPLAAALLGGGFDLVLAVCFLMPVAVLVLAMFLFGLGCEVTQGSGHHAGHETEESAPGVRSKEPDKTIKSQLVHEMDPFLLSPTMPCVSAEQ